MSTLTTLCHACDNFVTVVWKLCDACGATKATDAFDADVLRHAKTNARALACRECAAPCYSPKDTRPYQCAEGHTCGHLRFDKKLLVNVKSGRTPTLTCIACMGAIHARGQKRSVLSDDFACDAGIPDIGVREVPGTADCDLYRCMLSASIAIRRFSSRLRP